MTHSVSAPKAAYNRVDGSISVQDGAGIHHFVDADVARAYYVACIQEIGRVDPATRNGAAP